MASFQNTPVKLLALMLLLTPAVVVRAANGACTGSLLDEPVSYASLGNVAVLLADLDGDARPEILTSGNQVDQLGVFSLLANRGDGTFAAERLLPSGFGERLEDAADLNGDGIPELLASAYWSNGIAVYHGAAGGKFEGRNFYGTATHGGPSKLLDYDGDGLLDIVSLSFGSGNPVRVHLFRGRGDGTFENKVTFDTALPVAAHPSFRKRDGVVEIVAAEHSGHLSLLRLLPGGVSVTTLPAGPGFDLTAIFTDVNGDGIEDIVDTNDGDGDPGNPFEWIFVSLARADGTFGERKQLAQPRKATMPAAVRAADFDGDSHTDLVVSDFRTPFLYFYRGDGTGNFDAGVRIDAGVGVNDFATGDVNGDGRPDLVTVNAERSVSVIVNHGPCVPARRRAVRH
jgi:hypothetical protein